MWYSPYKLYLYPENTQVKIVPSSIVETLGKLDLIDREIEINRYATGDNFVSLLTFMGCSPNIELEPQQDKPFCYIEINLGKKEKFYSGINISRCLP